MVHLKFWEWEELTATSEDRKPTNITQKAQMCLKNFLLGLCEVWMMSQNVFVFFLM